MPLGCRWLWGSRYADDSDSPFRVAHRSLADCRNSYSAAVRKTATTGAAITVVGAVVLSQWRQKDKAIEAAAARKRPAINRQQQIENLSFAAVKSFYCRIVSANAASCC